MTVRLISAFAALPLFFLVIYFLPSIYFTFAISLICVISVYELLKRSKIIDDPVLLGIAYLFAAITPFWAHFGYQSQYVLLGLFILTVLLFVVWMLRLEKVNFEKITSVLFAAIVLPLFLSATIGILHADQGKALILVPFIAAWMTDTGAYFFGTFFGKHKLAPRISPKKTIEGAIGGVIVCILSFLIYGIVLTQFIGISVNYTLLVLVGLVLSPIAEIGDLSLSLIKREYNIKDYGVIFPGHGGILDRFDSVLFTAPATLILLNYFTLMF